MLVAPQEVIAMTVGVGMTGALLHVPFAVCILSIIVLLLGMWAMRYMAALAKASEKPLTPKERECFEEIERRLRQK